jgi:8-oxo-dGTP diphosphatase
VENDDDTIALRLRLMQYSDIYNFFGRLAYKLVLPIMRFLIRRTERVYAVLEYDGQILLTKNWLGRQDWQLPGGGKRRGETPYQTAIREVEEEVGVHVVHEDIKHIKDGRWQTDGLNFKYTIISARLRTKPELALRRWEVIDALWLPVHETKELHMPIEISSLLS